MNHSCSCIILLFFFFEHIIQDLLANIFAVSLLYHPFSLLLLYSKSVSYLICSPCLCTLTFFLCSMVLVHLSPFVLTPSTSQLIKLPYILLIMSMHADKRLDEKIYESNMLISKVCAHTISILSTLMLNFVLHHQNMCMAYFNFLRTEQIKLIKSLILIFLLYFLFFSFIVLFIKLSYCEHD